MAKAGTFSLFQHLLNGGRALCLASNVANLQVWERLLKRSKISLEDLFWHLGCAQYESWSQEYLRGPALGILEDYMPSVT